jgi:hypothetical protein
MKYITVILTFLLLIQFSVFGNESKFLSIIQKYAQAQSKPTLVYFDLQWCQGSMETVDDKKAILKEFEGCYAILICTSDISKNLFSDIQVDSFVDIRMFFPYQLSSFKERRRLARLVKKHYDTKTLQYYFVPSAFNIFENGNFYFFNYYLPREYKKYTCK